MYALDLEYFTKCLPLVLMILDVTEYPSESVCQCLPSVRMTTVLLCLRRHLFLTPTRVPYYSISVGSQRSLLPSVKGP